MRATREGWFITREGIAHCPAHIPDWVPAWRERKRLKRLTIPVEHAAGPMLRGGQLCSRCGMVLWAAPVVPGAAPPMTPRWPEGEVIYTDSEGTSVIALDGKNYQACLPYWPKPGHRMRSLDMHVRRAIDLLASCTDDELEQAIVNLGPEGRRRLRNCLLPPSRRSKRKAG